MIICLARRLFTTLVLVIITILIAAALFFIIIHDKKPLQSASTIVNANTARMAKSAIARNIKALSQDKNNISLNASAPELASLIEIIERSNKNIAARLNLSNNGLYLETTFRSYWQRYINLSLLVVPSANGLTIEYIRVGDIALPTQYTITFVDFLLKQLTGIKLLENINHVAITEQSLAFGYTMVNNKQQLIGSLTNLAKRFGSQHNIDNDLALTALYFRQLQNMQHHSRQCQTQPLSFFIKSLAKSSSEMRQAGYSAVEQNRAAIFALAVYFGSYRFEYFIGKLSTDLPRKPRCYSIPTIAKRQDLTKHFVYSAAIELLSSKQTSEFVGELKELLDSNLNGSGFSFVDLMADRAGVLFAQLSTMNERSAFIHQRIIQGEFGEQDLFPSSVALPENLSQHEFEDAYQHIDAPAYLHLIKQIDDRLNTLPLYSRDQNL